MNDDINLKLGGTIATDIVGATADGDVILSVTKWMGVVDRSYVDQWVPCM